MKSTQRSKSKPRPRPDEGGRLKIGNDWNAIRIIALSQGNPLKAIAEFVENSIDAHAKSVTITRGREHGEHYLTVKDDGDGVPRDANGLPDFKYVATHIFVYEGQMVLLHGFIKKTQRTPKHDLDLAVKRQK